MTTPAPVNFAPLRICLLILFSTLATGQTSAKTPVDARLFACHCDNRSTWKRAGVWHLQIEHEFVSQDKCRYSFGRADDGTYGVSEPATTEWQEMPPFPHNEYRWYCGGDDVPKEQSCKKISAISCISSK